MNKPDFKQMAKNLVAKMTLEEKVGQLGHESKAIPRLGIPEYNWWGEALHGVARMGRASVFPAPIGMAASYNDELLQTVGDVVSDEGRANYNQYKKFGKTDVYQGITFWSPNINIFRDPRWGRGHETYGEDPYLTARMGTAYVKGLQGDGKYRKADATLKHYAVHSGPESSRVEFDSNVSDKDLYETYLWAFKYCIENAKPSAVMGAYNMFRGEPCCASKLLLQDILREEFGFDGYVVSDCGAIDYIHRHQKYTSTPAESAAIAVNNGCQLNCGRVYASSLEEAVEMDLITEETITNACELLFEARFRLGMFADDCEYDNIPFEAVECKKHIDINLKMAEEGIVLLKNDGILPLDGSKKVAVIGPNADSVDVLLGNYNGIPSIYYTALRGIQEYCDPIYAKGSHLYDEKRSNIQNGCYSSNTTTQEALVAVNNADVVIMCMGLDRSLEGEGGDAYNIDAAGDKRVLDLPEVQIKLYEKIKKLGKPIIFVNMSGSCVNLKDQKENCNAVLQVFYPGAMGGLALANVLFGKVSPSGRLPLTFYESCDDLPEFTNYSMENRTYKFYRGTPVYEFGYGITYSYIKENWIDQNTVEVINCGNFDTAYSVLKFEYIPHKNLCDFKKIYIKKGETIKVTFGGK